MEKLGQSYHLGDDCFNLRKDIKGLNQGCVKETGKKKKEASERYPEGRTSGLVET